MNDNSIRTAASLLLWACLLVLATVPAIGDDAALADRSLLEFIATYEAIESFSCDLVVLDRPVDSADRRPRYTPDDPDWLLSKKCRLLCDVTERRIRIEGGSYWVHGEPERPYRFVRSFDGDAAYTFSLAHHEGTISLPRKADEFVIPNPLFAVGFDISDTYRSSRPHDSLSVVVLRGKTTKLDDGYLIENVAGAPDGSPGPRPAHPAVQDIRFYLEPQAGFLPREIWISQRTVASDERRWGVQVVRFAEPAAGVYFPVEFNSFHASGKDASQLDELRFIVEEDSLRVNEPIAKSRFTFAFPAGASYHDLRTDRFFDGQQGRWLDRVRQVGAARKRADAPAPERNRWLLLLGNGVALIVLGIAAYIVRRRRSRLMRVILCASLAICSVGCSPHRTAPEGKSLTEWSSISTGTSVLALSSLGPLRRVVEVDAGESLTVQPVFTQRSDGNQPVEFSRQLETSCGCADGAP